MSENLKTIRELAEELGVSKTAINKKVSDKERKQWFSKNGNRFLINENGQKAIKSMFLDGYENQKPETENPERQQESKTENLRNDDNINYVRDIINYQNAQIEDLKETKAQQFKQLNQMQNLLDQQQRLALQDKKLLEEYKAEIKDLKALTTQTQSATDEQGAVNERSDVEAPNHPDTAKSKKWWRFGK